MNAVIYSSRGGNTRKLAEAVARGAGVTARSVAAATPDTDRPPVDILFIGASIYAGRISGELRRFLRNLGEKQAARAVVFGSSTSGKSALAEITALLESKGIPVAGESFHCLGSFLCFYRGHPDADDLARAEEFARRLCEGKE
jgi:flavodoxin